MRVCFLNPFKVFGPLDYCLFHFSIDRIAEFDSPKIASASNIDLVNLACPTLLCKQANLLMATPVRWHV